MKKRFIKNKIINIIKASAGFPSPAENYIEEQLDLNKYLIKNLEATFFIRVSGNSMINAGIFDNDILIVDKSMDPVNQSIVIVSLNGELVIKRISKDLKSGIYCLKSENLDYPDIKLDQDYDMKIWGVATCVIHNLI